MVAKISNKSKLKTGMLQTQSVNKKVVNINVISKKAIETSASQIEALSPAAQTSSNQNLKSISMKQVGDTISNASHTLPNGTSVTPTPSISSDALSSALDAISSPAANKIAATQIDNNKKTTYESLTNLSNKRPEIIALTNFSPLYYEQGEKTEQGKLFELYVELMRQLETASVEAVKNNELWSSLTEKQNLEIKKQIESIRGTAQGIYDILRRISVDRSRLSLHDPIYQFSPQEFANSFISTDSIANLNKVKEILTWGGGKIGLVDAISNITKIPKNAVELYSSTQLWLLLLYETRNLLESHSVLAVDNVKYQNIFDSSGLPYREKNKQISLKKLQDGSSIKEKLNGLDGGNLQSLLEAYSGVASSAGAQSNDASQEAETQSEFLAELNAASEPLLTLAKNIGEVMKSMDDMILTSVPQNSMTMSIALMLHLVCKEMRHSACYSSASDKLLKSIDRLSLGTGVSPAQVPLYDFFGKMSEGFKVLEPGQNAGARPGLTDLCYHDESDNLILTLEPEQIFESSNTAVKSGGEFFFSQENIIEFTNTANLTLLSRIESFSKKINGLDEAVSSVAIELGLLSAKDDKVFSKDVTHDGIFSADPQTFLENIFNDLTKELQAVGEFTTKNTDLGINALIKFAGSTELRARSIRSLLFMMSIIINRDIEEFSFIDSRIYEILKIISDNKQNSPEANEINNDRSSIYGYVDEVLRANNTDAALKEESFKFVLKNKYKNGSISYLPCRYETAVQLGEAIRKNPTFKMITKIMRKVRDIFFAYSNQRSETLVGKISVYTIMLLTFNALCKIVERTEVHDMAFINTKLNTISYNTSLILEATGLQQTSSEVKNILKSAGILTSSGKAFDIEIYAKINEVTKENEKSKIKNGILGKIFIETSLLNFSTITILNTIKTLKSQIESSLNTAKKLTAQSLRLLSNYMDDPSNLEFLLVEPQLTLLLSNLEDVYQSFRNFSDSVDQSPNDSKVSFTNYQETLSHSKKIVDILKSLFQNAEFKEKKGYNKKIMTVGLPQGLIKNHIARSTANSKNNKHDDIIKISVYKIDLINNDIVYKPKSFLFEASRYPVRVPSLILSNTLDFSQIPTRNYSFFPDVDRQGESFYYDNNLGEEYSFLSTTEKNEIIQNHSMSFLLENYLKIVSGLVLSENTFNLSSSETKALLDQLEKKSSQVEGSISFSPGPDTVVRLTEKLFPTSIELVKQLVQPKKFDRIFNIIFDPEFIVDTEKTSPQKLDEFINSRKVIGINQNDASLGIKDVDKTSEDATLEAYFAVIETHAPASLDSALNTQIEFAN